MINEKQANVLKYHEGSILDILDKDSVPLYLSHIMDEEDNVQGVMLVVRYPEGIDKTNKFFMKLGAELGES